MLIVTARLYLAPRLRRVVIRLRLDIQRVGLRR